MVDTSASGTGAATGSSQGTLADRLAARALAMVGQASPRDLPPRSGSPASPLADGDPHVRSALARARVPSLYQEAVWTKVRAPAIREWTIPLAARTLRRSDPEPPKWALLGHGLLILGPVGTGKSSAAALVAVEAARIARTIRWSYVPDLCDLIARTARERSEEIRAQSHCDLLIWDDFGVRDMADWEIGFLDQIVENRYRNRKPMLVTSNWVTADFREDGRLSRMVDRWRERVASNVAILGGTSMREGMK